MPNGAYALDISQYMEGTSGPLTDDKVRRCLARGIDRWAISLIDHELAMRQVEVLAKHPVEIQSFTAYDTDDYQHRRELDERIIDNIRRNYFDLQKHWIDVEEPGFVNGQHQRNIAAVEWLVRSFEGVCPTGIYTSNYMWGRTMGGTAQFSSMPLWFAAWNGVDSLDVVPAFGGWTRGEMHQTLADLTVEDVWCDTNYYERVAAPPPTPPPGPPPAVGRETRIEPIHTTVEWTDKDDERLIIQRVRLVRDN